MTYKEIFSLVIESNLSEYVCVFCFMGLSLIEKKIVKHHKCYSKKIKLFLGIILF